MGVKSLNFDWLYFMQRGTASKDPLLPIFTYSKQSIKTPPKKYRKGSSQHAILVASIFVVLECCFSIENWLRRLNLLTSLILAIPAESKEISRFNYGIISNCKTFVLFEIL